MQLSVCVIFIADWSEQGTGDLPDTNSNWSGQLNPEISYSFSNYLLPYTVTEIMHFC
jgi:hypothetical protein